MTGSIERIWRRITKRPLIPVLMLVVAIHVPTDPNRRSTGYGGVLPVPGPATPTPTSTARTDPLMDQQARDQRAARGRVLYADGRGASAATVVRRDHKGPCPERRVVQGRAPVASPNS